MFNSHAKTPPQGKVQTFPCGSFFNQCGWEPFYKLATLLLLVAHLAFVPLNSAAIGKKAFSKSISILLQPQKTTEACISLQQEQTLVFSFLSQQPLDFNLHYHAQDQTLYPLKKSQIKSLNDTYVAKKTATYCLMWKNTSTQKNQLNYQFMALKTKTP